MLEQVKSSLQSLSNNIWATIAKVALIALFAFAAYIFIKYFQVFAGTVSDAVDEVGRELDAVKVESMASTNPDSSTSYLRTFLMVLLTIGKVLIVTSTTFFSFMLIEAHALLPATVLCFVYGTLVGALFGYYHAKGRWPWTAWFRRGGARLDGGALERVYLERRVEERINV